MYLVENTVEKAIYEISVGRRMSHIARSGGEESSDAAEPGVLESRIEAANTSELQEAALSQLFTKSSGGGEMVGKEHLWDALFRYRPPVGQLSSEAGREVARRLGATAAEERRDDAGNGNNAIVGG